MSTMTEDSTPKPQSGEVNVDVNTPTNVTPLNFERVWADAHSERLNHASRLARQSATYLIPDEYLHACIDALLDYNPEQINGPLVGRSDFSIEHDGMVGA